MHSKKEQKHMGQTQLPGVTEYDEQRHDNGEKLPKGMPSLDQVKSETARLGLPASDAEDIYLSWQINGFRAAGSPIRSWRAQVKRWHRNQCFPSQKKKTQPKPGELMTYEILDDLATWAAFKKLDVHKCGQEFKEWCEKNKRPKLVASFIKLLNSKL